MLASGLLSTNAESQERNSSGWTTPTELVQPARVGERINDADDGPRVRSSPEVREGSLCLYRIPQSLWRRSRLLAVAGGIGKNNTGFCRTPLLTIFAEVLSYAGAFVCDTSPERRLRHLKGSELLGEGNADVRTTMIETHVLNRSGTGIRSPKIHRSKN